MAKTKTDRMIESNGQIIEDATAPTKKQDQVDNLENELIQLKAKDYDALAFMEQIQNQARQILDQKAKERQPILQRINEIAKELNK